MRPNKRACQSARFSSRRRSYLRFPGIVFGLLVLLCTPALHGQTTANAELKRAITAYEAGDLQRALQILDSLPAVMPDQDRAVRILYRGLISYASGNMAIAEESFRRAVEIDPALRMDPNLHSPGRVRAFDTARDSVIASWKSTAREAEGRAQWTAALDRWLAVLIARPDDQEALSHATAIRNRTAPQPPAETQALVVDTTTRPAMRVTQYSPGTALALGLVLPGGGEFYTGSSIRGLVVLLAAGGAAAAALTYKSVSVQCLSVPVDGFCPPEDVVSTKEEQPYLVPGLAAAGIISVVGALDAWAGARRKNARAREAASQGTGPGARLEGPSLERTGERLTVSIVRVRF
jgi:tetratricopeptide (TPR) repeat protein